LREGWEGIEHRYEILPSKQNQERNIIKLKRIRRGGFFPLRSAKRNISHHEVIYRIRRIYRAEGISCALRAQSEGAKTSRKREVLLLPSGRQGRRPLEAQGDFARLWRFSEGKWRREPTIQSRLLPQANMSAERDLRLCLKNSRTFEKVRSKLSATVVINSAKIFENNELKCVWLFVLVSSLSSSYYSICNLRNFILQIDTYRFNRIHIGYFLQRFKIDVLIFNRQPSKSTCLIFPRYVDRFIIHVLENIFG